jgi:BlaI family transcriptional regulator, penicillinase repressor
MAKQHNSSPPLPDLTRPEYDVLRALWRVKRASVREVHDALFEETAWAYTTTKTVMDRMAAKGLLERLSVHGVAVYEPRVSKASGMAKWVNFFASRVLERDVGFVLSLIKDSGTVTASEMKELETLVSTIVEEKE